MSTPIRRMRSGCCARAASGHAAAPPSSVMSARRFTQSPRRARVCMYYCGHKRVSHWPKRSSKRVGGRSGAPQALPMPSALERLNPFIRSIRSSLNRTFGGIRSTGFTRGTSICGKVALLGFVISVGANSSAFAATDHAAATPANRLMNSRRFTVRTSRVSDRKASTPRCGRRLLRCGISTRLMTGAGHERPKGDVCVESVRLPTADIGRRKP
jgi:hypothetical protein